MCGIAGYLGSNRFDGKSIQKILETMERRGPDSSNFNEIAFYKKFLSIFFSRLKIIDSNNRSNQPFIFKDKVLIFNGAIYNYLELKAELKNKGYTFRTTSDTEVLIKVLDYWGESGIKKLEGMWSFFFYDKTKKQGILCRDRFGEKPLFYYNKNNEFVFASEVKTINKILNKHQEFNLDKVDAFLRNGYRQLHKNEQTFFKEIYDFPKGHFFIIKNNKIIKKKYFEIKHQPNEDSEEKNLIRIKEKLFNSIKTRLRADFPIAFFLSGGIDSNALAYIAKNHFNYDVNTFSVIGSDSKYDESNAINYTSNKLGVSHQNLKIDLKKTNFLETLITQVNYHNSPITSINSLLQFSLLEKIKKSGFKIVISGVGSDEIFSGYYDHHLAYLIDFEKNKKIFKPAFETWKREINPIIRNPLLKNFSLFKKQTTLFDFINQQEDFKKKIFRKKKKKVFSEKNYSKSFLKNRLVNMMMHESIPVLLKEDDLNSMYHSIENRSPFLDSKLFKECLNMPTEYYIQDGMAKSPLRKILKGIVPDKIRLNKRKIGFNAPIEHIFNMKNKQNLEFILKDSQIFDIIDKDFLIKLIKKNTNFSSVENIFLFNFISTKVFLESMS